MPWQIESSRIDPVSINMADYATPRPFKASVSFQNMPCSITQQAKGIILELRPMWRQADSF